MFPNKPHWVRYKNIHTKILTPPVHIHHVHRHSDHVHRHSGRDTYTHCHRYIHAVTMYIETTHIYIYTKSFWVLRVYMNKPNLNLI